MSDPVQQRNIHEMLLSDDAEVRAEGRELKSLEHLAAIRGYLQFFVALAFLGLAGGIIMVVAAASSSSGY